MATLRRLVYRWPFWRVSSLPSLPSCVVKDGRYESRTPSKPLGEFDTQLHNTWVAAAVCLIPAGNAVLQRLQEFIRNRAQSAWFSKRDYPFKFRQRLGYRWVCDYGTQYTDIDDGYSNCDTCLRWYGSLQLRQTQSAGYWSLDGLLFD